LVEVLHGLDVRVHPVDLAVGDEHDTVHTLEDQLAGCVVVDLAGDGVQMELYFESADRPEIDGQKIEEQSPFSLSRQRNHLSPGAGRHLVVYVLEVGRLPAQPGPVVDQLAVDLPGRVVDHRHAAASPSGTEELVDLILGLTYELGRHAGSPRTGSVTLEHGDKQLIELSHRRFDPKLD